MRLFRPPAHIARRSRDLVALNGMKSRPAYGAKWLFLRHIRFRLLDGGKALAFGTVEAAHLRLAFGGAVIYARDAPPPHGVNAFFYRFLPRQIASGRFFILKPASLRARKSVYLLLIRYDVIIKTGRVSFSYCINPCHKISCFTSLSVRRAIPRRR